MSQILVMRFFDNLENVDYKSFGSPSRKSDEKEKKK